MGNSTYHVSTVSADGETEVAVKFNLTKRTRLMVNLGCFWSHRGSPMSVIEFRVMVVNFRKRRRVGLRDEKCLRIALGVRLWIGLETGIKEKDVK